MISTDAPIPPHVARPEARSHRSAGRRLAGAAAAILAGLAALGAALPVQAAEARYRVEVLVFRNLGVDAAPDEQDRVRRFHPAWELEDQVIPEAPVPLDKRDGTFANIWARLERLPEYEPLVRMTWEQTLYDYHPPVRLHDAVVLAEELHFPGDVAYLDLERTGGGEGWFDAYVEPLYRLDGTVQLRRSRFLHLDLDLEYRLDGPAWDLAFADPTPGRLEPGFSWVGEAPREAPPGTSRDTPLDAPTGETIDNPIGDPDPIGEEAVPAPTTPFRLHRLRQSRQVRTDTLQYFDSAFLGAIVRVTPIAPDVP